MKFIDWIAIVGALAWSPHLLSMLKQWLTKSKIRVITNRNAEIGFTTFGPIFNLRLAFVVENRDIVISDIKIRLKHESGEEKVFEWQRITQPVLKMTTPDAGVMPFEKDQTVLAIKLNQKEIEERFIQFREISFIEAQQKYVSEAVRKITYLKAEQRYNAEAFLREQEMTELYSFNKHAFAWKEGKYSVSIEIQSPQKFELFDNNREFLLTQIDITELSQNKDIIELDYRQSFLGVPQGDQRISWQWINPTLVKK